MFCMISSLVCKNIELDAVGRQFKPYLTTVWGMRVEKPSQLALVLKYFRKFMGQAPIVTFALRLYNSYNHALAPGPHTWPSLGLLGHSPTPSAIKQWMSDVSAAI